VACAALDVYVDDLFSYLVRSSSWMRRLERGSPRSTPPRYRRAFTRRSRVATAQSRDRAGVAVDATVPRQATGSRA